jgi:hypothetical protein
LVPTVAIDITRAHQRPAGGVCAQRRCGESVAAVVGPQNQVVVVAGEHQVGQAIAVEVADGADVVARRHAEGVRAEFGDGAIGVVGVHQPVLHLAGVGVEQEDVRYAVAVGVAGYLLTGWKK